MFCVWSIITERPSRTLDVSSTKLVSWQTSDDDIAKQSSRKKVLEIHVWGATRFDAAPRQDLPAEQTRAALPCLSFFFFFFPFSLFPFFLVSCSGSPPPPPPEIRQDKLCGVYLSQAARQQGPGALWSSEDDRTLLIGLLKHGSGRFQAIVQDDTLGLRPALELVLSSGEPRAPPLASPRVRHGRHPPPTRPHWFLLREVGGGGGYLFLCVVLFLNRERKRGQRPRSCLPDVPPGGVF